MPYETDGAVYVSNSNSDIALESVNIDLGDTLSAVVWVANRLCHNKGMF